MKNLAKKVMEVQALIAKAKRDEIDAIEVDSTWESVYRFELLRLTKTRLTVAYIEWDGRKEKQVVDAVQLSKDKKFDFEETKYMLSWIKRCIKKGYRRAKKENESNE